MREGGPPFAAPPFGGKIDRGPLRYPIGPRYVRR